MTTGYAQARMGYAVRSSFPSLFAREGRAIFYCINSLYLPYTPLCCPPIITTMVVATGDNNNVFDHFAKFQYGHEPVWSSFARLGCCIILSLIFFCCDSYIRQENIDCKEWNFEISNQALSFRWIENYWLNGWIENEFNFGLWICYYQ